MNAESPLDHVTVRFMRPDDLPSVMVIERRSFTAPWEEATFRGLMLPDATIHLCGAVTEKDEAARSVEVDLWIEGADGERFVIGTGTVRLS